MNHTNNITKYNNIFIIFVIAIVAAACSDSSTGIESEEEIDLETNMVEDLPADPNGSRGDPPDFTYFDLEKGEIVPDSDSDGTTWDLAFAGTTILTNSGISGPGEAGAIILDIPFEGVDQAPEQDYNTDKEQELAIPGGSGNGWYTYTADRREPFNAILPLPDKTIVVRTADGNYAKINMLSYYEGNPDTDTDEFAEFATRPDGRHYTFEYMLRADGEREF